MREDVLEKLNETSNALLVSLFLGFLWLWGMNIITNPSFFINEFGIHVYEGIC
jgi:hypothetical protein